MSRIGKKPIIIPPSVEIKIEGNIIKAKGPKGEDFLVIPPEFRVNLNDNLLEVSPVIQKKNINVLWGTTRALLNNLLTGAKEGFKKDLEISGVGYWANVEGNNLVLKVGYINPIIIAIPQGIEVKIDKNIISVSGLSKEKVGQFASDIKAVKKVEPYKGKGIKYVGEFVRRKAGKKMTTSPT